MKNEKWEKSNADFFRKHCRLSIAVYSLKFTKTGLKIRYN